MTPTYQVILTAAALANLEAIAAYIRRDSPQNAASVAAAILSAVDGLETMPGRFKVVGHSRKRGSPVHSMDVRPYLLYYRVDSSPDRVFILHIRHGARRQPKRFE